MTKPQNVEFWFSTFRYIFFCFIPNISLLKLLYIEFIFALFKKTHIFIPF